jgi:hypothetical protein
MLPEIQEGARAIAGTVYEWLDSLPLSGKIVAALVAIILIVKLT